MIIEITTLKINMKKTIAPLLLTSCEKEEANPAASYDKDLGDNRGKIYELDTMVLNDT
jgi:hypothetical protein